MSARLLGRTGKAQGIEQPVSELLTLGSGPGNALRIDSRTLSRQHAQIVKSGAAYYVEDLGSRNGTFLNGQRVRRFPVRNLDVISLGPDVDLIFLESGSAVMTIPRAAPVRASIVWMDGPLEGRVDQVPPDAGLVLGRASGLDALGAISRRHAVITVRGDRVTVEDLGSANGTLVNSKPIIAVTPLSAGDEISLGSLVRVRLSIEGAAPARAEPAVEGAAETIAFGYRDLVRDRPLDVPRGVAPSPAPDPPIPRPTLPPTAETPSPVIPPASFIAPGPVARAEGDLPTMTAPREAAVAPRSEPSRRPEPPPLQPGPEDVDGRTMMAPREAAVAPRQIPPVRPSSIEPPTFSAPPEAGAMIPDGLAARARAAKQVSDATIAAPSPPPKAPVSDVVALPPAADHAAGASRLSGVILDGPTRVTFNLGCFEIGRDSKAALVVDSRDISRRHARLYVREYDVQLEDLQTVNGCFVNDVAVNGSAAVPDGSRVRFATVEYAVMYVRSRDQQ